MTKEEIEIVRQKLLKKYHAKKEEIEYAEDDMEEAWVEEELEKYRVEIKACVARIKELESAEEAPSISIV
jgi:tRNA U34 5-carboxymethylaminomethyl modifying GTPase MnmE/TrmE